MRKSNNKRFGRPSMIHQLLFILLLLLRWTDESLSFLMMSPSSYRYGSSSFSSYPSSSTLSSSFLLQKKNRNDARRKNTVMTKMYLYHSAISRTTIRSRRRTNHTQLHNDVLQKSKNALLSSFIKKNKKNNIQTITITPPLFLRIREKTKSFYTNLQLTIHAIKQGISIAIQQSWWSLPMIILILFPILTFIKNGSLCAQMPSWWSMSRLHYLHTSCIGHWICFGFLTSNVFYFLSAFCLLNGIIPFTSSSSISSVTSTFSLSHKRSKDNIVIIEQYNAYKTNTYKKKTANNMRYPLLGWLVLCSGSISLLYHSFQAWGAINIAESLCYIDHGLAISSGCCFLDKCGMPSSKTLLIGIISLCMLTIGGDTGSFEYTYPIIHSFWHLGSASATISWAFDGSKRRKRFIMDTLQERRKSKLIKDH